MNENTRTAPGSANGVTFVNSEESTLVRSESSSAVTGYAYNELADFPVQMIDPVLEVQKNLAHLEDLQARMKFMMREVRYLLKIEL